MWKSQSRLSVSSLSKILLLLTGGFLLCVLCGTVPLLIFRPQLLPDQVMISVAQLPKSTQWQVGADTGIRDEDIRGIWMSDIASRERFIGNTQGGQINEYVVEYADADHAKQQYANLAN